MSASSAEGTRVAGGKLESAAPDVSAAAPEDTDVALDAEAVEVPDGESPEDEASEAGAPEAEAPAAEASEAETPDAEAPTDTTDDPSAWRWDNEL